MVTHACNPSSWKAGRQEDHQKTETSLSYAKQVSGQPGLHSIALSQTDKNQAVTSYR